MPHFARFTIYAKSFPMVIWRNMEILQDTFDNRFVATFLCIFRNVLYLTWVDFLDVILDHVRQNDQHKELGNVHLLNNMRFTT